MNLRVILCLEKSPNIIFTTITNTLFYFTFFHFFLKLFGQLETIHTFPNLTIRS